MTTEITGLLLVQGLVIWGIDCTDFVHSVKDALGIWTGWRPTRLRPFDCSLCASFWAGILYVLIVGLPWQTLVLVVLVSHLSSVVAAALGLLRTLPLMIIGLLNKLIDKIWN